MEPSIPETPIHLKLTPTTICTAYKLGDWLQTNPNSLLLIEPINRFIKGSLALMNLGELHSINL